MKRITAVVLCVILALSLAACGKGDAKKTTADTTSSTAQTTESSSRKRENLKEVEPVTNADGDVVLTCPTDFYDEYNPPSTELTQEQKEAGFKKAVVNDDGTLSYILSREDFEKVKVKTENDTREAFRNYPKNQPFIKNVAASEDFSVINVQVDQEEFTKQLTGIAVEWEIGLYAQLAQVMFGVQPDKISVDIVVTDAATGEVINATHYPLNK